MDAYDKAAAASSRAVIKAFSTSFGRASRSFPKSIRQDIYNIYGLVRLADEIVDSYKAKDAGRLLADLEQETFQAIARGFSTNLVVHAFAGTARHYGIGAHLLRPFYTSMEADLDPQRYDPADYGAYIHGSAEVVGLMCLKVFTAGDADAYDRLTPGAQALGAAFQKVNFLRDLKADHQELGRYYFPVGSYDTFDNAVKRQITDDIRQDFRTALSAIRDLPAGARPPVMAAYRYYVELLKRLEAAPADAIKSKRIRVPDATKLRLLTTTLIRERIGR